MKSALSESFYEYISEDEDARVCKDITDNACEVVPGNFLKQLLSQVFTKTGDALSKPSLILTWLLGYLGAPAAAIGLLVPVREAGSLLPQMVVGGVIRGYPVRKWFWVVGSILQGIAVLLMGAAALFLKGAQAGWTFIVLVALFSLARGICSIASKDLIGKTIPKTRRGRLSGLASTISGWSAVAVGLFFAFYKREEIALQFFAILLGAAGMLWLVAAGLMARLEEKPGATDGGGNAVKEAIKSLGILKKDPQFRRFCLIRALLASTVLSMPFYVILAQKATGALANSLGILMVSGSVATALSAFVWGKLADRSSKFALAVAGTSAGAVGILTAALSNISMGELSSAILYGVLFFLIGLCHTGIRLGRKTYLVDMASADNRAAYVAVSNTLMGLVLLASGSFGLLADMLGEQAVILVFACLGLLGGTLAFTLPEVE